MRRAVFARLGSAGTEQGAQLTQPISRSWGVAWLAAAVLVTVTAVTFGIGARRFWMLGAIALVASQVVIVSAWRDAWAGTIANAILLAVVAQGWLTEGPSSFSAQLQRDALAGFVRPIATAVVSEADLAPLPAPVQRYLRLVGVVGQPRIQNYRLRFRGQIRKDAASRWMPFEAEQQSFADQPTRLCLMRARMFGVPMESFHRSVGGHATMQLKVAGLLSVVDARGEDMDPGAPVHAW